MSTIDEIKARIDIVDLVSETVKLRRSGKNYTGFCPFHANTRTPAFVVFPESGTWRCFGQCGEGGDIFGYVMKKEGWEFSEALRYLAERAGVQLEPLTPQKKETEEQYDRLRTLLEEAVTFYRYHLTQTPAGRPALEYLQRRGLQPATLEAFGLGYAPDSWDAALTYFTRKGYSPDEMLQVGLITPRQSGEGVYDRFRKRITFPIRDGMGRMTGFGARVLDPEDMPKFINSPQTVLFDKGHLLYGLDQARKPIRALDQVVIVEGYLDVIVLHQAGFTNTVAPMGTALTEEQMRLLKRLTRRIVLALDADAAGEKATLHGLEVARQTLERGEELTFDARGLLRHEARLQADVRVTAIPDGMDPDEVVLRDPAEWRRIIDAAQPVVVHVMETLARHREIDDPKVKSEIAAQVLPLIEDVPNPVERDAYRQRLARLLRVDERSLVSAQPAGSARPARRKPGQSAARPPKQDVALRVVSAARLAHSLEISVLTLLLRQPEALYLLDRSLQQFGLSRLAPEDFEAADHQMLARLVLSALAQEEQDPLEFMREHLEAELEERAAELWAPLPQGEPNADQLLETLVRSVVRLRLVRIGESLNQLRYLQEEVQQQGDLRLGGYQELTLEYTRTRERLDRALKHPLQLD